MTMRYNVIVCFTFLYLFSFVSCSESQVANIADERIDVVRLRIVRDGKPDEFAAGIFVGKDSSYGYFATANHAAGPKSDGGPITSIKVKFYGKLQEFDASLALQSYDAILDLAVVQTAVANLPNGFKPLLAKDPTPATLIFVIGHPYAGDWSIWPGSIQNENAPEDIHLFTTTRDFSLAGGYSGGPVLGASDDFLGMHIGTRPNYGLASKSKDIVRQLEVWKVPTTNVGTSEYRAALQNQFGSGLGPVHFGMSPDDVNAITLQRFTTTWSTLPGAGEFHTAEVRYFLVNLTKLPTTGLAAVLYQALPSIHSCWNGQSYMTFLFAQQKLIRISVRLLPDCVQRNKLLRDFAEAYSIPNFNPAERVRFQEVLDTATVAGHSDDASTSIEFFLNGSPSP
jgi:hypothetical protein